MRPSGASSQFDLIKPFKESIKSIYICSLQQAAKALDALEQQKLAAQSDLQPLLSKDPSGTSSTLPLKLSAANNKHNSIAALADVYTKK